MWILASLIIDPEGSQPLQFSYQSIALYSTYEMLVENWQIIAGDYGEVEPYCHTAAVI